MDLPPSGQETAGHDGNEQEVQHEGPPGEPPLAHSFDPTPTSTILVSADRPGRPIQHGQEHRAMHQRMTGVVSATTGLTGPCQIRGAQENRGHPAHHISLS